MNDRVRTDPGLESREYMPKRPSLQVSANYNGFCGNEYSPEQRLCVKQSVVVSQPCHHFFVQSSVTLTSPLVMKVTVKKLLSMAQPRDRKEHLVLHRGLTSTIPHPHLLCPCKDQIELSHVKSRYSCQHCRKPSGRKAGQVRVRGRATIRLQT